MPALLGFLSRPPSESPRLRISPEAACCAISGTLVPRRPAKQNRQSTLTGRMAGLSRDRLNSNVAANSLYQHRVLALCTIDGYHESVGKRVPAQYFHQRQHGG